MKKILYFSHNPFRDASPDGILAHELRLLGNHVWLNTFLQNDAEKVCHIKPDIVVLPEIRVEYAKEFARQCGQYGIKVVVKMCEFGISEESLPNISEAYKEAIFGRFPVDHLVDKFLAWGPEMKRMMVEQMGITPDKIDVCGAFQFGHYFVPAPPVSMKTGKKKTILFAAGFPYADRNKEFCMPEADATDSKFQSKLVEKDQYARGRFLDTILKFAKKHSDKWEILVKPHPGEKQTPYDAVFRRQPVRVLNQVCGRASLEGVDFLVHSGSTMGYEAHLLNIPSINLYNNCEDVVVSKVSPNCNSEAEFFRKFNAINKRPKSSAAPKDIIEKLRGYYGACDEYACRRAAVAIDKLPVGPTLVPDEWQHPKEAKYLTDGVILGIESWFCAGCRNTYFVANKHREMVKCPFCGIANVKTVKPETKNEEMQKVCNAGHPTGSNPERGRCVSSVRKARKKKQRGLGTAEG
jgi:surface carbohydrate biosynthesis protein